MSATQTAQARSPWADLAKHFKNSFNRANFTFEIGREISDSRQEKAEKERLERENQNLRKQIEQQQEKDTMHICRQCSIRSANG